MRGRVTAPFLLLIYRDNKERSPILNTTIDSRYEICFKSLTLPIRRISPNSPNSPKYPKSPKTSWQTGDIGDIIRAVYDEETLYD